MEFSRQEYWSGLPFPSPGDLPNAGIELRSPAPQADALPSKPPEKSLPPEESLCDQCKEIEEKKRVGKTRYLFKKIRDTKGTFHAKMGSIKDKNSMDLTEAEDTKKRWQEYTEDLYKKRSSRPR